MKRLTLFVGAALLSLSSVAVADEATKITFEEHIKPIFRTHCLNCHNQGEKKGGLALDSYTATIEGGGSGEVVYDDGDPEASRLWQLVNHDDTPIMPPKQDKIPADQLALLSAWIEGGILENSGSKAKAKKKNSLAFVASTGGKPDGPAAMPQSVTQKVMVPTERAAAVTAIETSPWAPLAAIAGQQQIVLYNTDSSELLGILPFAEGVPQSLRFSRDGSFIVAGGGEHSLRGLAAVYDVKTGERVAQVGDELDTVFDADCNADMSRIALGGPQKMLRIFDATDGELLFDLKKHTDWIYSVAYSPDGILVASGDRSGGLCVWEADTGRLYLDLTDHKGPITSLSWRDDSNVLASASEDGTVKLWDMIQGKVVKSITAHAGGVTAVRFDHEGRIATAGINKRASLWDAAGKKIKDYTPMSEAVLEVAISHDGKKILYGDWSGAVMLAMADDPKSMLPLAANPPTIPERIEKIKTTLTSIRTKLSPLKVTLDQQVSAVSAAKKPLAELQKQIAGKQAASETAAKSAAASRKTADAVDGQLPGLVLASRDAHDAIIAARITLGTDPQRLTELAAVEKKLADQLLAIVAKRNLRVQSDKDAKTQTELAAKLKAESNKLAAGLPALQAAVAAAEKKQNAAAAAHDAVANQLTQKQKRIDALAAELK